MKKQLLLLLLLSSAHGIQAMEPANQGSFSVYLRQLWPFSRNSYAPTTVSKDLKEMHIATMILCIQEKEYCPLPSNIIKTIQQIINTLDTHNPDYENFFTIRKYVEKDVTNLLEVSTMNDYDKENRKFISSFRLKKGYYLDGNSIFHTSNSNEEIVNLGGKIKLDCFIATRTTEQKERNRYLVRPNGVVEEMGLIGDPGYLIE